MMLSIDLELKLLSPSPIIVNGVPIYPISLKKIIEYGYLNFTHAMNLFTISKEDLSGMINKDIASKFDEMTDEIYSHLIFNLINKDNLFKKRFLDIFSLACQCKMQFNSESMCFYTGNKKININTFVAIQDIIKLRNGIMSQSEIEENPADERTRALLKRKKELQKKLKKSENSDSDSITLADYISILAFATHKKISDILEYDLYQFYNQFNRLAIMKEYDTNILALVHGASSEKVELTHWLSKIQNT